MSGLDFAPLAQLRSHGPGVGTGRFAQAGDLLARLALLAALLTLHGDGCAVPGVEIGGDERIEAGAQSGQLHGVGTVFAAAFFGGQHVATDTANGGELCRVQGAGLAGGSGRRLRCAFSGLCRKCPQTRQRQQCRQSEFLMVVHVVSPLCVRTTTAACTTQRAHQSHTQHAKRPQRQGHIAVIGCDLGIAT